MTLTGQMLDGGSIPKIVQSQIASENSEEILEYLRMKCTFFFIIFPEYTRIHTEKQSVMLKGNSLSVDSSVY